MDQRLGAGAPDRLTSLPEELQRGIARHLFDPGVDREARERTRATIGSLRLTSRAWNALYIGRDDLGRLEAAAYTRHPSAISPLHAALIEIDVAAKAGAVSPLFGTTISRLVAEMYGVPRLAEALNAHARRYAFHGLLSKIDEAFRNGTPLTLYDCRVECARWGQRFAGPLRDLAARGVVMSRVRLPVDRRPGALPEGDAKAVIAEVGLDAGLDDAALLRLRHGLAEEYSCVYELDAGQLHHSDAIMAMIKRSGGDRAYFDQDAPGLGRLKIVKERCDYFGIGFQDELSRSSRRIIFMIAERLFGPPPTEVRRNGRAVDDGFYELTAPGMSHETPGVLGVEFQLRRFEFDAEVGAFIGALRLEPEAEDVDLDSLWSLVPDDVDLRTRFFVAYARGFAEAVRAEDMAATGLRAGCDRVIAACGGEDPAMADRIREAFVDVATEALSCRRIASVAAGFPDDAISENLGRSVVRRARALGLIGALQQPPAVDAGPPDGPALDAPSHEGLHAAALRQRISELVDGLGFHAEARAERMRQELASRFYAGPQVYGEGRPADTAADEIGIDDVDLLRQLSMLEVERRVPPFDGPFHHWPDR